MSLVGATKSGVACTTSVVTSGTWTVDSKVGVVLDFIIVHEMSWPASEYTRQGVEDKRHGKQRGARVVRAEYYSLEKSMRMI